MSKEYICTSMTTALKEIKVEMYSQINLIHKTKCQKKLNDEAAKKTKQILL